MRYELKSVDEGVVRMINEGNEDVVLDESNWRGGARFRLITC